MSKLDAHADETYKDLKSALQTGNLDEVISDINDARKNFSAQDYQEFLGILNKKVDDILPGVTIVGTEDQGAGDKDGKPDLVVRDQDMQGFLDSDEASRLKFFGDDFRFADDAQSTFDKVESALRSGDIRGVIADIEQAKLTKAPEQYKEYLRELNEKVGALLPGVKIVGTFSQATDGKPDLVIETPRGTSFLDAFEGDRLIQAAEFKLSPEQSQRAAQTSDNLRKAMETGNLSNVIADLEQAKAMYTPQQYHAYLAMVNKLISDTMPGVRVVGTFQQPTGRTDLEIRDSHSTGLLSAGEGGRLREYGKRRGH